MRLIKKQSKKTYKGKDGNERHYTNFFLECDNGKRILIRPVDEDDYARLDMVCVYE